MLYLVIETLNGELWRDVALFKTSEGAFKFIESCAWATDRDQNLYDPVVECVSDDFKQCEFMKKQFEKRFRQKWRVFE